MAYVDHAFSISDEDIMMESSYTVSNKPPIKEIALDLSLFIFGALGIVLNIAMAINKVVGDTAHGNGFDRNANWVYENGVFAFGFWEKDGEDVDEFVVGIRYNLGDKATNFHVWTVGEGLRVAKNSTFRLAMDVKLVLTNNQNGIIVWSSNITSLGVQKASLLDNGNLVLLGNKDEVIWESFSSPTNTLLPCQSLHYPLGLRGPFDEIDSIL
ncbi:G-type lectin S-receptor-like serine/threonine-protein kinase SD3-1 [Forsythia ovata]|uniref:G-type lectin S-receptor-like serine/threonine-protein kinase SD3-1 n=1 Tax=Forsythia ovata TaxID=205694 RepID=A0ABD1T3Q5_9LAMI